MNTSCRSPLPKDYFSSKGHCFQAKTLIPRRRKHHFLTENVVPCVGGGRFSPGTSGSPGRGNNISERKINISHEFEPSLAVLKDLPRLRGTTFSAEKRPSPTTGNNIFDREKTFPVTERPELQPREDRPSPRGRTFSTTERPSPSHRTILLRCLLELQQEPP